MSCCPQGYQALYIAHEYLAVMKYCLIALGRARAVTEMSTLIALSRSMHDSCRRTVRGNARCPHFSLAIISVTVQLWIQVFWVISVQFNIRNTLPKFCPFLLGHPVYEATHFICMCSPISVCSSSDQYLARIKGVLRYTWLKVNEIHTNEWFCPTPLYTHENSNRSIDNLSCLLLLLIATRQSMQVHPNSQVCSSSYCYSGKVVIVIYSECVFVTLIIQQIFLMHHIVICGLPDST